MPEESKAENLSTMAKKTVTTFTILVSLLCLSSSAVSQTIGTSGYHLVKKIRLGGSGGWDHLEVDPGTHRVFIARTNYIMVVDPDQGRIVGEIPNTPFAHSIAIADEFNKGYISSGGIAGDIVFDLSSFTPISEVKTDKYADDVIYDPFSKRILTFNGPANSATAIDPASDRVVGTVHLGGSSRLAASDAKGKIFVNLEDRNSLVKLDAKTLKIENTWPLAPCDSPVGLAIDADHEILIVGCYNSKLMVFVDGNSGKVIGTLPIGEGIDGIRFDPVTGYAFASCNNGTLTIAHEDSPVKFSLVETLQTQPGARTMTVDYANHNVYLVTADFGPTDNPEPGPAILPDSFSLLVYVYGRMSN